MTVQRVWLANVGRRERWGRVGLGIAFLILAGLLWGGVPALLLALLGLGLLATAWARY